MTRFPLLSDDQLDAEQQRMAQVASHGGPYRAFLRAPVLWQLLQPLRRYLAAESVLNAATREAIVLSLARHWRASAMFAGHEALALGAGLTAGEISAIGRGEAVALIDSAAAIALQCLAALLAGDGLPDALFEQAEALIGERGLVELVALIGFFSTIGLTLNLAGIGAEAPFAGAPGTYSPADESSTDERQPPANL